MKSVQKLGDAAVRWALPEDAEPRALLAALKSLQGVTDAVVTETHACVHFVPGHAPDLSVLVPAWQVGRAAKLVTIAVRYDGEDLEEVSERSDMTPDEVVALHVEREYTVRMVGFLPGFAYLREVHPRIQAPRRATPRTRIPAGAIGIAAGYTGVYPFASPGGWNLVGTAVGFEAFSPERGATLALGDRVRFVRAK